MTQNRDQSGEQKPPARGAGIIAEIVRSHLASAAEEMGRALVRTAFNPVIYDILDFGISIYDERLDLIAEGPGTSFFIGANDYSLKKAIEYVGAENLEEGDILMMNYPYWSSAHTYDASLFAPVFLPNNRKIQFYEVIRAHWMDLGAKDPGYVLDSTSIHQEGIVLPGTKVYKRGEPNKDILEILRFNSRMPEEILGDLNAQVSAIRTGERRLHKIFEKFGAETVLSSIDHMFSAGEKQTREALATLPHGAWTAEDFLDDDGITEDMVPMKVTVTISSEEFKADFTGSAQAQRGPVNMPFGATYSICKNVFKSLTTPNFPSNAGNYRALTVEAPPNTLFHAVYPSATFTLWAGTMAVELLYKAIASGFEGRVSASSGGDLPGMAMMGFRRETGRFYFLSNNESIGWGGAPDHDGSSALQAHALGTGRNTPIEVLELRTGMFIESLGLREDSGGPGKFRGGLGVRRDIRFVEDGEFLSIMKKSKTRPWPLAGGMDTEPNCLIVHVGTASERRVGTYRAKVSVGDKYSLRSAGGAGYGDPAQRDPLTVYEDFLEGYVSIEAAKSVYKVAISANLLLDEEETKTLRREKRPDDNEENR